MKTLIRGLAILFLAVGPFLIFSPQARAVHVGVEIGVGGPGYYGPGPGYYAPARYWVPDHWVYRHGDEYLVPGHWVYDDSGPYYGGYGGPSVFIGGGGGHHGGGHHHH